MTWNLVLFSCKFDISKNEQWNLSLTKISINVSQFLFSFQTGRKVQLTFDFFSCDFSSQEAEALPVPCITYCSVLLHWIFLGPRQINLILLHINRLMLSSVLYWGNAKNNPRLTKKDTHFSSIDLTSLSNHYQIQTYWLDCWCSLLG